jgi:hypothetical protein
MKFVAFGEAFDCDDGFFVGIGNRGEARGNTFAIQENGAGATLAFAAAVLGAGELEILAKDIKERAFGVGGDRVGTTVDSKFEGRVHRRFGQCVALLRYYTQHFLQQQQSPELARATVPQGTTQTINSQLARGKLSLGALSLESKEAFGKGNGVGV